MAHSADNFSSTFSPVAVFLGIILVLGLTHNLLVLLLFVRFKAIRTPINMILLNISLSDFLVCAIGTPFSFAASNYGRWLIGYIEYLNSQVGKMNQMTAQIQEHRILLMVVSMITCYLQCWLPYGMVALIGTFGNEDLITPTCSVIPSILAKSSTVINPIIYVIMNKQFYRCFVTLLRYNTLPQAYGSENSKQGKDSQLTSRMRDVMQMCLPSSCLSDDRKRREPYLETLPKEGHTLVLGAHHNR